MEIWNHGQNPSFDLNMFWDQNIKEDYVTTLLHWTSETDISKYQQDCGVRVATFFQRTLLLWFPSRSALCCRLILKHSSLIGPFSSPKHPTLSSPVSHVQSKFFPFVLFGYLSRTTWTTFQTLWFSCGYTCDDDDVEDSLVESPNFT